jgi:hypothetical protein
MSAGLQKYAFFLNDCPIGFDGIRLVAGQSRPVIVLGIIFGPFIDHAGKKTSAKRALGTKPIPNSSQT